MNFIEAIREVENNNFIISCASGAVYNKGLLNPKRLSDTTYVVRSITTEKERKGEWKIFR
ncbi:hypothetical protein [Bacillus xiapuensis]|uniref:Uncharacterized protein n=1 Tax=Bacillus xiapuensis TaxID=2014075 RepID=A0ABU6N8D7_9BACI|nr:hypothetical protein [Bacillus xiapuensis]